MGADHRRADARRQHRLLADQRRTDPTSIHHGQRSRAAVHQRGGQLQRLRRRVPRHRHDDVRVRQLSGLDDLRRRLLAQVRPGRSRLRDDQPVPAWIIAADLDRARSRQADRRARRRAGADRTALEQVAQGQASSDFGAGHQRHRQVVGRPAVRRGVYRHPRPLDAAPYYAVRVHSGCLGTKGGPKTDDQARCSTSTGRPSKDCTRFKHEGWPPRPWGMSYGGATARSAHAIVWGFLAGQYAASHSATEE